MRIATPKCRLQDPSRPQPNPNVPARARARPRSFDAARVCDARRMSAALALDQIPIQFGIATVRRGGGVVAILLGLSQFSLT